jgi:dienelactone hydrolase
MRSRVGRSLLLALVATLAMLPVGARAGRLEVSVPVIPVPGSRQPDRPYDATLTLPDGKAPFPAVILLHGCGGIGRAQHFWVDRLVGWGYAVLRLDSFSARGVTTVCPHALQPLVTPVDRAGDVLSAALWLRTQRQIDGARIGVLGQSHGGGTAVAVTDRQYEQLYPGLLKAAVDYYGPCRSAHLHGTVPMLALAGDADTWGAPARTCQAFAATLRADQPMTVTIYPGVVHAFDVPNVAGLRYREGHPMQYDAMAAEDSYTQIKAFFARYLGGAP